ncbi:MAG: hypothetical protein K6F33_01740 [Bacteroidales bacterium]|nr:hypothetical protein [Bacteroidales bacterium]
MSDSNVWEDLRQKPYWIVDILPMKVPVERATQYCAFEKYFVNSFRINGLYSKFVSIVTKLNCYFDLEIKNSDFQKQNPQPLELSELILRCVSYGYLDMYFPSENSLLTLSNQDLYMTLYNPSDTLMRFASEITVSEGLFLRKGEE